MKDVGSYCCGKTRRITAESAGKCPSLPRCRAEMLPLPPTTRKRAIAIGKRSLTDWTNRRRKSRTRKRNKTRYKWAGLSCIIFPRYGFVVVASRKCTLSKWLVDVAVQNLIFFTYNMHILQEADIQNSFKLVIAGYLASINKHINDQERLKAGAIQRDVGESLLSAVNHILVIFASSFIFPLLLKMLFLQPLACS